MADPITYEVLSTYNQKKEALVFKIQKVIVYSYTGRRVTEDIGDPVFVHRPAGWWAKWQGITWQKLAAQAHQELEAKCRAIVAEIERQERGKNTAATIIKKLESNVLQD